MIMDSKIYLEHLIEAKQHYLNLTVITNLFNLRISFNDEFQRHMN